jgi:hypothetical protein
MRGPAISERTMNAALRAREEGASIAEVTRLYRLSAATFHRRRKRASTAANVRRDDFPVSIPTSAIEIDDRRRLEHLLAKALIEKDRLLDENARLRAELGVAVQSCAFANRPPSVEGNRESPVDFELDRPVGGGMATAPDSVSELDAPQSANRSDGSAPMASDDLAFGPVWDEPNSGSQTLRDEVIYRTPKPDHKVHAGHDLIIDLHGADSVDFVVGLDEKVEQAICALRDAVQQLVMDYDELSRPPSFAVCRLTAGALMVSPNALKYIFERSITQPGGPGAPYTFDRAALALAIESFRDYFTNRLSLAPTEPPSKQEQELAQQQLNEVLCEYLLIGDRPSHHVRSLIAESTGLTDRQIRDAYDRKVLENGGLFGDALKLFKVS